MSININEPLEIVFSPRESTLCRVREILSVLFVLWCVWKLPMQRRDDDFIL